MHTPPFYSPNTHQEAAETPTATAVTGLLQQLSELSVHLDGASDVTAFMTFLGQWASRRFTNIEIRGMAHVRANQSHLFISNHRDILMDAVLINHALLSHQKGAARAVIGSNLMEETTMASLMSLAGCLVVPRGEMPLKQKFIQLKQLSQQIDQAQQSSHVWIAQREGRTKNGIDQTNPAILKMLSLAKPKHQSIHDYLTRKRLTPVAISYEWDPSDGHKAMENHCRVLAGEYGKVPRTDGIQHLIDSLEACSGKVVIEFGQPFKPSSKTEADQLHLQLDAFIRDKYQLFPSHRVAAMKCSGKDIPNTMQPTLDQFEQRASKLPLYVRKKLFELYSNSFYCYQGAF